MSGAKRGARGWLSLVTQAPGATWNSAEKPPRRCTVCGDRLPSAARMSMVFDRTTVQEKVAAAQEPVCDEEVASQIATNLLRQPEVAARAMTDTFLDYDLPLTLCNR